MAYSYPIWNTVTACIYKSDKSWGAKDTSDITTLVGSSPSNSYELVNITSYRKFFHHEKYGDVVSFRTKIDGKILKEVLFHANNGRAGKYIKTRTALSRVKGL